MKRLFLLAHAALNIVPLLITLAFILSGKIGFWSAIAALIVCGVIAFVSWLMFLVLDEEWK